MSPMPPVPREAWGATVPLGPPMPRTPTEVWLHWAVVAPSADPKRDMRKIEATGKQRFGRFSYSYCYHPPSRLWLVGAGQTIGAHTGGRNSKALGLSLIAAPGADDMPHLVEDTVDLLRWLIDTDRLAPGVYPTAGHRDQKPTECPGDKAYALIPDMRRALAGEPPAPPSEEDIFMAITEERFQALEEQVAAIKVNTEALKNEVIATVKDGETRADREADLITKIARALDIKV